MNIVLTKMNWLFSPPKIRKTAYFCTVSLLSSHILMESSEAPPYIDNSMLACPLLLESCLVIPSYKVNTETVQTSQKE